MALRRRPALIALLTIGVAAVNASAQIAPASASPRANAPATGTAVLRGRVVDSENGRPLRRALVRALAPSLRENHAASTDEQGRYEMTDLPAGRYTVSASKGNYVGLSYGQAGPTEPGKPIDVADGQTVEKIDFTLRRGGVITGHVVDEYGDPVPNVQVAAMRSQFVQGHRRLVPGGRIASTDDLGEYRLFGLTPSDYFVSATYRPPPASAADADAPGFAVTFAPGTPSAADAQRVALSGAQSVDEVNIQLVPVKLAQVRGTAVNSNGQPMTGSVGMTERNNMLGGGNGAQIAPDGSFVIRGVAPGEYVMRAQNRGGRGERPEIATATISVAGQNIDGVQLVVIPPSTASGAVLVDPAAAATIKASSIFLMVSPIDPQMNLMDTSGRVKDDFTFEAAVQPGTNIVRVMGTPPGMALKAVRVGGVDVTDTGFDVKPNENVSGIEVELTSHPTVVSGQVTDSRGAPTKDSLVVVFALDEAKWEGTSRYIQTARPDQDGKFKMSGLPPGDYQAVATSGLRQPGEIGDPEILKQIRNHAVRLSLGDGENKVVDLKVTPDS